MTVNPAAPGEPRVKPSTLVDALIERGVIERADLVTLLGEARHALTLTDLERAIARETLIGDSSLAALKGEVSGLQHLTSTAVPTLPAIDAGTAKAVGAIVLQSPTPTVAMVEDLPSSVEVVRQKLGSDFQIVMCTLAQFLELHRATYEGATITARTALNDIYEVFDAAMRQNASDIHVSVGSPPTLRVNGRLIALPYEPLEAEWVRQEIGRIGGADRLLQLEKQSNVDMAFPYGAVRFRLNFGADKRGLTMAARKIPTRIPSTEEIGLPSAARALTSLERGLVLVTGPTGSGKSTTLAAILATIASTSARHIITLEDPIEFNLPQGKGVTHQRELGVSFDTFAGGLRQALRQDPDVILVGEMRDQETIRAALTAAETGHLVFGTLHTYDSAATVARIVSTFPSEEQEQVRAVLSYILKGTISQTLLPTANGHGRVAAFELMLVNPAIANNLRKVDGFSQLRQTIETSSKDGMQTMDMAIADLVNRRVILEKDALEKVVDVEDFMNRVS